MATTRKRLESVLALQREAARKEGAVTAQVRRTRVSRMALAILENMDAISQELSADYGCRPPVLTTALETMTWVEDVQNTLAHLEEWMAPLVVPGGIVEKVPKGVVGIMGAWNFPIVLTFEPAMAALAAGNRVMLNFPEYHTRTGALIERIFAETFALDEVAVVLGTTDTAQYFSELPFDHLFFTGSPRVGRLVSKAAAENLVPVTMELGGKNPVVIGRGANLDLAARRIAATRVLNSGQICLCPDYALVPEEMMDTFVQKLCAQFGSLFPTYLDNPNVVSIVNESNFDRIQGLIADAVARGAKMVPALPAEDGRLADRATRRIQPCILCDVPETAEIAHNEIFGPVIAVYPYSSLQQAVDYISKRPSPLAAYWYGDDDVEFRYFLDHTKSGGVTRNDGLLHSVLPDAPFGGIGNSGSGAYHGRAGFDTFTHSRTIASAAQEKGFAEDAVDGTLFTEPYRMGVAAAVEAAIESFRRIRD